MSDQSGKKDTRTPPRGPTREEKRRCTEAQAQAILHQKYQQDECLNGFHKACPGGPPGKGRIGILCWCTCHRGT